MWNTVQSGGSGPHLLPCGAAAFAQMKLDAGALVAAKANAATDTATIRFFISFPLLERVHKAPRI